MTHHTNPSESSTWIMTNEIGNFKRSIITWGDVRTLPQVSDQKNISPVGHSPEKRVWGCVALKTSFLRLSCSSQDPRLRLKSVHKTLIWKINVNFCLQNQQFSENMPIFSSTSFPKKFEKLSVLKPLFWWKSAHKPSLSWQFICSQGPKFRNPGRTYLPAKKFECPPREHMFPLSYSKK